MKILILCTGNSCRSQMAHGILKAIDQRLEVFSAGTDPAEQVQPNTLVVMDEIGIDIQDHKPENVSLYLSESFDFVITVCDDAKDNCPVFSGESKQNRHIGFEDPYYASGTEEEILDKYREVRNKIIIAFKAFYLQEIKDTLK